MDMHDSLLSNSGLPVGYSVLRGFVCVYDVSGIWECQLST